MASKQQFCLRWNNHQSTLISVFDHLLESGTLVDCTLAAEGQFLKAHKVVLSACSPYLEALLSQHYENHPILILKDVSFNELKSLLDYMYRGEVNISQEQLGFFLKVAESLQVKGLTDSGALNESKEIDCSRDSREFVRVDRASGGSLKRNDIRKHTTLGSFAPLAELPPNQLINALNHQKDDIPLPHEINTGSLDSSHAKEGSLSPASKRKRVSPKILNNEQIISSSENYERESFESLNSKKGLPPTLEKADLSNTQPTHPLLPESNSVDPISNQPSAGLHSIDHYDTKRETERENLELSDIVKSEESVDIEEDLEEDIEDGDLSRPGPSNVSNSHVAGIPWHIAGEGNGEDLLLANQQDSQDESRLLPNPSVKNKINVLCNGCGSVIIYKGAVVHMDSCILTKAGDENYQHVLDVRIMDSAKKTTACNRKRKREKSKQPCGCKDCLNLTKSFQEDIEKYCSNYHPYATALSGPVVCKCGKTCKSNRGLVQHLRSCSLLHTKNTSVPLTSTPDQVSTTTTNSTTAKEFISDQKDGNKSKCCSFSPDLKLLNKTEICESRKKHRSSMDTTKSVEGSNVASLSRMDNQKPVEGSNVASFSRSKLESKVFQCICKCGATFQSEYNYKRHTKFNCNRLKQQRTISNCKWCSFVSDDKNLLRSHVVIRHNDMISKMFISD